MMQKFKGFFLLLSIWLVTGAQAGDRSEIYARMDAIAAQAPDELTRSVDTLTDYLVADAKTDLQKARVIYSWIAHNIVYDLPSYLAGQIRDVNVKPETVLEKRVAVCDGYTRLFQAMAKRAGLKAERITGTAKGYGVERDRRGLQRANHAWNAVELEGAWYLVDATWGAGYIDSQTREYVPLFNEFFFLTPPEQFRFSHLPDDALWQLLEKQISFKEFASYVDIRPAFFQNNLGLLNATSDTLVSDGDLEIRLSVPPDTELTALLLHGSEVLDTNTNFWRRQGGEYRGQVALPGKGRYDLQIFAKATSDPGKFPLALVYHIIANGASRHSYAKLRPAFFDNGLELASHTEGVIDAKSQVEVTLNNPRDAFLSARLLDKNEALPAYLVAMQRKPGTAMAKVLLPFKGRYQLQLFVAAAADQPAQLAAEYTIVASEGAGNQARYPQFYSAYMQQKAELLHPFYGVLKSYQEEEFRISAPGANRVAVVMNNEWHYLEKKGDEFSGLVPITSGVIKLVGSFGDDAEKFQVLAQFDAY